jgi:hypothetical protein
MANVPIISDAALGLDAFPDALKRHVDPRAPLPLREMGAKGLVPGIGPQDLLKVLYNLQFDQECRQTASKTFRELPPEIRTAGLAGSLPGKVLDFCARQWLSDPRSAATLIRHRDVADETIAFLAGKCDTHLAEVIAENQARFVRYPTIVEQMYMNAGVHQSIIDRVLEFVQRSGVDLDGLPGLKQALKNGLEIAPEPEFGDEAIEEVVRDNVFASILQTSVNRAELEESQGVSMEEVDTKMGAFAELLENAMATMKDVDFASFGEEASAAEKDQDEEKRFVSKQVLISNMKIAEKVRLATIGSKEERMILLKDSNRLVYTAALLSPKMAQDDLKALAKNKNMPHEIIAYIADKKELLRDYSVVVSLANNPKTPLRTGIRLINFLRDNDVRALSRSRNVSPQLARMAKSHLQKKGKM